MGRHGLLFLRAQIFFILHALPVFESQSGLTRRRIQNTRAVSDVAQFFTPRREEARGGEHTCLALWLPGHPERKKDCLFRQHVPGRPGVAAAQAQCPQQTRPPFGTSEGGTRGQALGKVTEVLEERVWKSSHRTPGGREEML